MYPHCGQPLSNFPPLWLVSPLEHRTQALPAARSGMSGEPLNNDIGQTGHRKCLSLQGGCPIFSTLDSHGHVSRVTPWIYTPKGTAVPLETFMKGSKPSRIGLESPDRSSPKVGHVTLMRDVTVATWTKCTHSVSRVISLRWKAGSYSLIC